MISGETELLSAFNNIQPVVMHEEYRAYYDDIGWIIFFAANIFPADNDKWVTISKELYITHNWHQLRVVNGKIIKQDTHRYYFPLTKSTIGVKVVKNHAGIVVEQQDEYTDIEFYDNRNN